MLSSRALGRRLLAGGRLGSPPTVAQHCRGYAAGAAALRLSSGQHLSTVCSASGTEEPGRVRIRVGGCAAKRVQALQAWMQKDGR